MTVRRAGTFSGNVWRKARIWQGRNIQWDRREQLPITASDTEGISEDLLFSKKLFNRWKVFDMAFFYINYGFV
jgi:hypothetical protein